MESIIFYGSDCQGPASVLRERVFESVKASDSKSNHGSKLAAYVLLETVFQIAFFMFSKQVSLAILNIL